MKKLCRWLAGAATTVCTPAVSECASWSSVSETVCDATQTVAQTVCDATQTVTQTVCDATQTVTQTICDSTRTVTQTICDSWGSIPLIGNLLCLLSHVVSTVVCAASHVVSTIVCVATHVVSSVICAASHVVASVVCIASHIVTSVMCVVWTIVKAAACIVVGGASALVCKITALLAGPGPILRTGHQTVRSTPRPSASGWSFILGSDLRAADSRSPYEEEGIHIEYRLVDGRAEWAVGAGADFMLLTHNASDLPPFAVGRAQGEGPLAVSYDDMRLGDWGPAPALDMIAAGGDRAIAKAADGDDLLILVTGHPYAHYPAGGGPLLLPQSAFKLDPELGARGARTADLLAHVRVPGDDEMHPATERFPAFRVLFGLTVLADLGKRQQMDMWFPPRIWHKVDLRPQRDTAEPPPPPDEGERYPTYEHVVYDTNNPAEPELPRHSVAFNRVLDLGVGLSHLHEQHDHRFGGEMDNLDPLAEVGYQYANGPIRDFGGWVDGTTIYYALVQLKSDEELKRGEYERAFAILWADEQLAFTERWRVLDVFDRSFTSPFKPIVGVAIDHADQFYPDSPFMRDHFWSPFRAGNIRPASRMAVARQLVAVTGVAPQDGERGERHELYTIHFAWPTMDKTWRWRALPRGADPAELLLREDATIVVGGTRQMGDEQIAGRWFQRYLPADGQEQPSVEDRSAESVSGALAGTKPASGYAHPWSFVAAPVFTAMHQRFSHLGVYEPVRSRIQLYRLTIEDQGDLSDAEIESTVWQDRSHTLKRSHLRLNWSKLPRVLAADETDLLLLVAGGLVVGWNPVGGAGVFGAWVSTKLAEATDVRTHPSIYNDPLSFRVLRRGDPDARELGWIMTHFDKRDDKLDRFDDLPRRVVLSDRDTESRTITVTVTRHMRNDPRAEHGRTVDQELDAVSPPQVRRATVATTRSRAGEVTAVDIEFVMARDPSSGGWHAYTGRPREWLTMNVWRVKLGALSRAKGEPGGWGVRLMLDRTVDAFEATDDTTRFRATWTPSAEERDGLGELLSDAGRVHNGTSVWFVGATGLACCADETLFQSIWTDD